jgi:hypothetical protein
MSAQLAEDEFPARTVLKGAQERLAAALAAGEAAAQSLARGRETLAELERRQHAVKAEVANEARSRAEAVEQGVRAVIGGAAQKRREIDDQLSSFEITLDILLGKNSDAQRAIADCEATLAAAVRAVVAEEAQPLLCRMQDCENAAAMLKSELRALQYSGRFGLCPGAFLLGLRASPRMFFTSIGLSLGISKKSLTGRKPRGAISRIDCAWTLRLNLCAIESAC